MDWDISQGAIARRRYRAARIAAILAAFVFSCAAPALAQSTTGVGSQFELSFWQSVESGNDPALYEAYLERYPTGTFAVVARVKLARLRQQAAPTAPAAAPAMVPAPASPPVATAAAPQPALAAPAPAHNQLATVRVAPVPPAPKPAPPPPPPPAPPAVQAPPGDAAEQAPYVTAAPPMEPAGDNTDSAALRRLLGALGDSQRTGAPPQTPIVDADAPPADTAPLASAPAPVATPAAAAPRLVQMAQPAQAPAAGPPVAVPDAAALSVSTSPSADPRPIAVGPLPSDFALPSRPRLAAIPPLAFPASFCSAEARNAFHDGPYVTAVETAKRNNDAAIAYMHQLQDLYDTNQLSGDINPMNAIAAEARAYGPVAAAAFSAQSTLVSAFSTLMAVPITSCEAPKQP